MTQSVQQACLSPSSASPIVSCHLKQRSSLIQLTSFIACSCSIPCHFGASRISGFSITRLSTFLSLGSLLRLYCSFLLLVAMASNLIAIGLQPHVSSESLELSLVSKARLLKPWSWCFPGFAAVRCSRGPPSALGVLGQCRGHGPYRRTSPEPCLARKPCAGHRVAGSFLQRGSCLKQVGGGWVRGWVASLFCHTGFCWVESYVNSGILQYPQVTSVKRGKETPLYSNGTKHCIAGCWHKHIARSCWFKNA